MTTMISLTSKGAVACQVFLFPALLFLLSHCSAPCFSQTDSTKIQIPMKNGLIFYSAEVPFGGADRDAVFSKALTWYQKQFKSQKPEFIDKKNGRIVGQGMFRIKTSATGNFYWIRPVISIQINEHSVLLESSDYYEKPVEKGISNEYSKIEYRWWDFRQGKPWSAEDQVLFKGIVDKSGSMLRSFKGSMAETAKI